VPSFHKSSLATASAVPVASLESVPHIGRRKRASLTTSTVAADGCLVPWLAATGPLSYTPEQPPDRDYYFQYNRVLPGIFAEHVNLRRHFHFGAPHKHNVRDVLEFWKLARAGGANRITCQLGSTNELNTVVPMAVYRMTSRWRDNVYVFIQHGSYQIVSVGDQPELESGPVAHGVSSLPFQTAIDINLNPRNENRNDQE